MTKLIALAAAVLSGLVLGASTAQSYPAGVFTCAPHEWSVNGVQSQGLLYYWTCQDGRVVGAKVVPI